MRLWSIICRIISIFVIFTEATFFRKVKQNYTNYLVYIQKYGLFLQSFHFMRNILYAIPFSYEKKLTDKWNTCNVSNLQLHIYNRNEIETWNVLFAMLLVRKIECLAMKCLLFHKLLIWNPKKRCCEKKKKPFCFLLLSKLFFFPYTWYSNLATMKKVAFYTIE